MNLQMKNKEFILEYGNALSGHEKTPELLRLNPPQYFIIFFNQKTT